MEIGIIGRSELMYSTASLLIEKGFKIPFILTSKESPEYKKTSEDFKALADKIGAEFLHTGKLGNQESLEFLGKFTQCDVVVSVNYSGVIPQRVIDLFSIGILNAHGGDLPRYRGNACLAWALLNAEERIGLCIHKMIGGELDSGDIIARDYLAVDINTTIGKCYQWMEERIPELFLSAVEKLTLDQSYVLEVQSKDSGDALRTYPRKPEDGRINFDATREDVLRLINASSFPFNGAYGYVNGQRVYILEAELFDDGEVFQAVNGQVVQINRSERFIVIACQNEKLKIKKIRINDVLIDPVDHIVSIRERFS